MRPSTFCRIFFVESMRNTRLDATIEKKVEKRPCISVFGTLA